MDGTSQIIVIADPLGGMSGVYDAATSSTTAANPADWFIEALGGPKSDSGIRVSAATAMTYAPWFQASVIISSAVAGVTVDIFERTKDDDRIKHRELPAWSVLNVDAGNWTTGLTLRQTLQSHALNWGNGYGEIIRNMYGLPIAISILHPGLTWPEVREGTGLVYMTQDPSTGERRDIPPDRMLHIKGLGFDGLQGYSVYSLARQSIGLGLAAEKRGSKTLANGGRPDVVLRHPKRLDKPEADTLLDAWEKRHAGVKHTARPALLTGGLEIDTIPLMSAEDAQWLEGRKFQRVDIASWFGLPPHKLGDDSRLSYNSVEAEERSYVSNTLMRWFRAWETEENIKLLTPGQRKKRWYFEHNVGGLIQGDFKTQASVAVQLRNAKIITQNEARKKFNLNSVDGGDTFENPSTASTKSNESADPPESATSAHRELLRDRIEHLVKTETTTIVRNAASKNPYKAIERFYERFEAKFADAIKPCLVAYAALCGDAVQDAQTIAVLYCNQSRDILADVFGSSAPQTLQSEIRSVVSGWTQTRPDDVCRLVFGEEE